MNVVEHWDLAVESLSKTDSIMKEIIETYKGEKKADIQIINKNKI